MEINKDKQQKVNCRISTGMKKENEEDGRQHHLIN